jgi:Na+-transporting NADH:ubiquinone oxidoreductase subunit NqrD
MKKYFQEFIKGIIRENPTFVLVLGLCPTLAVSVTVINGIGMGIAAEEYNSGEGPHSLFYRGDCHFRDDK